MIGILQDRKGFRKEIYLPFHYPEYSVAECDLSGVAKVGEIQNAVGASVREVKFIKDKEDEVFGVKIILYIEK